MRSDVEFLSHGTRISAWYFPAADDDLLGAHGRPCIVMAHGFGATKDAGLEPFAERFQAAGADVLVFDYRGFGTSDGDVRQDVNHRTHRQDYVAAVDHARTIEGVDPQRIFLWGSSYSGGHVIAVAARDKAIAGVISQGAAMDGLAAVAMILGYAGPRQLLKLTAHSLRDIGRAITRRTPHMIPIVGPPKSLAAITSDDGESGYAKIMGPTFVNEMRARGIMRIMVNRPVTKARRLRMPVFLVVAEKDTIAPVSAVERVGRKVKGSVLIERLDVAHFDIYDGEPFDKSVARQVEFIRTVASTASQPARRAFGRQ